MITRPTRLTFNSATLIDNISTNNLGNNSFSGLLFTDISEPSSDILNIPSLELGKQLSMNVPIFFRDYSEMSVLQFKTELTNISWSDFEDSTDSSNA